MNKVSKIYELCNEISPFELQESWDNSGLNLGSKNAEFSKIVICLELTLSIAKELDSHSLILTHHPLVFSPLRSLDNECYPFNIASILTQKHCSVISLHTNFDKTHLNTFLCLEVLGFKNFSNEKCELMMSGKVDSVALDTLAQDIKQKLNLPYMIISKASEMIEEIHIVCGSGASMIKHIESKQNALLITSDVKHHDAMIAKSMGLSIIDVGHYESEKYFSQILDSIMQSKGYECIIMDCKNPFYHC